MLKPQLIGIRMAAQCEKDVRTMYLGTVVLAAYMHDYTTGTRLKTNAFGVKAKHNAFGCECLAHSLAGIRIFVGEQ